MVVTSSGVISFFFLFKQKTAYEMRISDWSSDVCSSDLAQAQRLAEAADGIQHVGAGARRDALVDEQAVQVLRARLVVTDPAPRRDERRQQVGARKSAV